MMKAYWNDIEEASGHWAGIILTVEDDQLRKPSIHLQSGGDNRIRLSHHGRCIFWATLTKDYSGLWLVRAFTEMKKHEMSVMPIKSSDIQSHAHLTRTDRLKSWTYFFARELTENKTSFLYKGPWVLKTHVPNNRADWNYTLLDTTKHTEGSNIYEVKHSFDDDEVIWVNWWCTGSRKLISVKTPDKNSGRVKWWRKKVRENNLPPILAWYLHCLDAYIIIDGHSRLMASILEGVPPNIIVAYSAEENDITVRKKIQQETNTDMSEQLSKIDLDRISTEKLNQILIQIYHQDPEIQTKTVAWAVRDLDELWTHELTKYLSQIDKSEMANDIISRQAYTMR